MASTSVLSSVSSVSNKLIIDDCLQDSMALNSDNSDKTVREEIEAAFQLVATKKTGEKRKATVHENSAKRSRPQNEFVVYIKGANTNITKENPKQVQSDIVKEFGRGIKVQLAGDSLRLICTSQIQKSQILNADYLGKYRITTSRPYQEDSFRVVYKRGVIRNVNLDILIEDLISENTEIGLVRAKRISTFAEGKSYPTTTVLLEFEVEELPETVYFGWRDYEVRDYIPRPIRCFRCQAYGHKAVSCPSAVPCCPRCSKKHAFEDCKAQSTEVKCRNCGGPHSAAYRGCPKYAWVQDNIKEAVHDKKTYAEVFKANRPALKERIRAAKLETAHAVEAHPVQNTGPAFSTPILVANRPLPASVAVSPIHSAVHILPVRSIVSRPGPDKSSNTVPSLHSVQIHSCNNPLPPPPVQKADNEVVITVDKLIGLVLHLLKTTGLDCSQDVVKSCMDSALHFLGVSVCFKTIN